VSRPGECPSLAEDRYGGGLCTFGLALPAGWPRSLGVYVLSEGGMGKRRWLHDCRSALEPSLAYTACVHCAKLARGRCVDCAQGVRTGKLRWTMHRVPLQNAASPSAGRPPQAPLAHGTLVGDAEHARRDGPSFTHEKAGRSAGSPSGHT
jgi:hypothetical protein